MVSREKWLKCTAASAQKPVVLTVEMLLQGDK